MTSVIAAQNHRLPTPQTKTVEYSWNWRPGSFRATFVNNGWRLEDGFVLMGKSFIDNPDFDYIVEALQNCCDHDKVRFHILNIQGDSGNGLDVSSYLRALHN